MYMILHEGKLPFHMHNCLSHELDWQCVNPQTVQMQTLWMTLPGSLNCQKGDLKLFESLFVALARFGHADLLDDIIDHWDAKTHTGEREAFVVRLQQVCSCRRRP